MFFISVHPRPAPRLTHQGRRSKKAIDYYEYCEELRLLVPDKCLSSLSTEPCEVFFLFAPPSSWSKKKKEERFLKPKPTAPDIDNLGKALLDALFPSSDKGDSKITTVSWNKGFCDREGIVIFTRREFFLTLFALTDGNLEEVVETLSTPFYGLKKIYAFNKKILPPLE